MRNPTQAAHVLGKLLKHIGDERRGFGHRLDLFGTPQDQIQAMRDVRDRRATQRGAHGYPALTPKIKAGIFGLNAAALYGIEPTPGRCEPNPKGSRPDSRDAAAREHSTDRRPAPRPRALIAAHQAVTWRDGGDRARRGIREIEWHAESCVRIDRRSPTAGRRASCR